MNRVGLNALDKIEGKYAGPMDGVAELAQIIAELGAQIVSTRKRTAIEVRDEWIKNADPQWRRMSDLVFFNDDCRRYLAGHPASVINAENYHLGGFCQ